MHGLQVTPTSSEVQLWGHARNFFLVMRINSQCSCAPLGWNGRGRRGPFLSPRERCSVGWKGCFWWVVTSPTEQPHPSSTGPCERFMCLNIKACRLQPGGLMSTVPWCFRQAVRNYSTVCGLWHCLNKALEYVAIFPRVTNTFCF